MRPALDITALLQFSVSPLELALRGTLVYLFLLLLFRFALRRDTASMAIADILLLVLIADAAQNAMDGGYTTVADGFVLVGTIAAWNWVLEWAGFRFNAVRRLLDPPAVVLVRRGQLVAGNMRRERITIPELMAALREQGVDKLSEVAYARLEGDGRISLIRQRGGAAAGV